ncbi:MAG: hypothetical protein KAS07_00520 [Candidatus Pacebacteria bacterium]|nr:hypothetical protein [Candidatus Paceibacterota bacterium]
MLRSKETILDLFNEQIIFASTKKDPPINIEVKECFKKEGPCIYSVKVESETKSSLPVCVESGRKNKRKRAYITASKLAKKLFDKGLKKVTINEKDWMVFYNKEILGKA